MATVPFHPVVARWFSSTFAGPTPIQVEGWRRIAGGEDTLIAAPTGTGKTLAAFLWAVNRLVAASAEGTLEDRTYVVYVSPLKALSNDIEKNLSGPLAAIATLAEAEGGAAPRVRVAVRTGDTPQKERQLHLRRPPHILITTPESLVILLTAEGTRRMLAGAETVIVDEIHAVAADKRGAHLALSLERLDRLRGRPLQRIGLSATQKPIEEIARLLVGAGRTEADVPRCAVVDLGHRREMDLSVETTDLELGPIATHELRAAIHDSLARHVLAHRTTIVFVHTRRLVERVARALGERLGEERVAAHHGSLAKETRLRAEQDLKAGKIRVIVATASLELGIDVGHVDLVCHLGAPRSIAALLQRTGRSGHFLGAVPKGILLPLTKDDLVQCAAAVRAVGRGELDRLTTPSSPLDIAAQQMVAAVAGEGDVGVDDLFAMLRRAHPFRALPRASFDAVLEMLADGVSTRRGRRSAHLHLDRVNGRVRPRRGARLAAITSGGAIPDMADYEVVEDPANTVVGKVNEDFAIESMAGDVFLLGNRSWRIARVESGRLRVVDAAGQSPTIPFWLGEAPARTEELSRAVADVRTEVARRLAAPVEAAAWLVREARVDPGGAEQIVQYVHDTVAALGSVPTPEHLIAERFFDEAGGMQLVLHAPLGGRVNRALGLALRKRFCLTFDFELQAAATDDGVVLSLGEQHSFPLDGVFSMLSARRVDDDLTQAALVSPMFTNRWRWNATRALALLRHTGGRRVPMPIQRMRAEDLLAAVFPAQLACGDNHAGPIEPVDHPLVNETLDNCLHEAMDAEGLKQLLARIADGAVTTSAVETRAPSPMSHEILNANPYAFLDDAPLEERRARAVSLRRVDPELAAGIGALDAEAIAEVRQQAWPAPRDAEEVHDALLSLCVVPHAEVEPWRDWLAALEGAGRAGPCGLGWVAAERTELVRAAAADDGALAEIVHGWMDAIGPTTAGALGARLGVAVDRVEAVLARLESQGTVLRGRFTSKDGGEVEWCERGLLARIHRLTIGRLRKEIEAVSAADFMRFLFRWQRVAPGTQLHGKDGVRQVIAQLEGREIPGPAWERSVLPARIAAYSPSDLEALCLAGEVGWGRLAVSVDADAEDGVPEPRTRRAAPTRAAPLAFALREDLPELVGPRPEGREWLARVSPAAALVYDHLERHGASFLADIARRERRLPTEIEDALWELVACGLVTGDGIAGLRTLLLPEDKRRERPRHLRMLPSAGRGRLMPLGRWSLLRSEADVEAPEDKRIERAAFRLLRRWGVIFRELLDRERHAPRWRQLLAVLRRLEARGEVRGGRFVTGFVGEQYALPTAVDALRAVRRTKDAAAAVVIAAADPLNLTGVVTPGPRVPAASNQVIAYVAGIPVEVGDLGAVTSRMQGRAGA